MVRGLRTVTESEAPAQERMYEAGSSSGTTSAEPVVGTGPTDGEMEQSSDSAGRPAQDDRLAGGPSAVCGSLQVRAGDAFRHVGGFKAFPRTVGAGERVGRRQFGGRRRQGSLDSDASDFRLDSALDRPVAAPVQLGAPAGQACAGGGKTGRCEEAGEPSPSPALRRWKP